MAGNFWHSSHFQQWLLEKQDIMKDRQVDLKVLTEEEYTKIMIFFANFIQTLGETLKAKQQVIACATVFFKRFYAKNSLKSIDPLLMASTCVFLSFKVEEAGVIQNNRLIQTCQQVVKNKFSYAYPTQEFPYRMQNIVECEFYLLEMMDCCLILYHPYRPLMLYATELLSPEDKVLPLAWRIINDSLRTDVPLMYPPYMIALACLHMACVMQQKDAMMWFAELTVDMDKIFEITRTILSLYELWRGYDEKKEIGALFAKMPKPKLAPSRPPSQGPNGQESQTTSQSQPAVSHSQPQQL